VEIAMMADTTVVVLTPGSGDDVQAMKAGIMEIADILIVNKSDLPSADLLERQLRSIVEAARTGRVTPIVRTAGALGDGVDALADALEEHRDYLQQSDVRARHRAAQARHQVLTLARQRLIERVVLEHGADGKLEEIVARVAARELDPHAAADELIGRSLTESGANA
jgi:LAO/AO transport system kinase